MAVQRERAAGVIAWYTQYVYLLRRLRSGQPISVVHGCAGGGGAVEGTRRAGGAPVCIDSVDMPSCRRRFGAENFVLGDAMSQALLLELRRARRPIGAMYSPPCKAHSTQDLQKKSTEPSLIEQSRDVLSESGLLYSIENVVGAVGSLAPDSTLLRGAWFGLGVDRPRYFETNYPLHVDDALRGPGEALRARTCLGWRRRMRRMDPFGRPEQTDCCHGNLHAVQGDRPLYSTAAECAAAMGIDEDHMPYSQLAQAIPPDYAALVFAQMCMEQARAEFGAPVITHDEMVARPEWARRTLAIWLTGGGAPAPDAGLNPVGVEGSARSAVEVRRGARERRAVRVGSSRAAAIPFIPEVQFRELFHTHAGGYDRMAQAPGEPRWLDVMSAAPEGEEAELPEAEDLTGLNTLLLPQSDAVLEAMLQRTQQALAQGVHGTRVTLVAARAREKQLMAAGYEYLVDVATSRGKRAAFTCGQRRWCVTPSSMDYARLRPHMDPRDTGEVGTDKVAKQTLVWSEIEWDPERWRGKGLPADVEALMTEGAHVPAPPGEPVFVEQAQYAWDTPAALEAAISEADRAIIVGAMEYVPESHLESVLGDGYVHPWTMVQKGEKWRACHDYKCGTNKYVAPLPFELPTVWDAVAEIPSGAYMTKYDLRDGFWHCPVAPESRRRLMMRHPGTGRLMWPNRLPFGYAASPVLFCKMTEAIAQRFRERMAGRGVRCYCFVDDYLLQGESKEAVEEGGRVLEEIFEEFGLAWAPHKHRGPVQVMEFLGLLISNVEGHRRVGLTEGRLAGLQRRIEEWAGREPRDGRKLVADPREVAKLLGHLVFASQCVPCGRAYMQAMLAAFSGLIIDWKRGCVTMIGGKRGQLTLEPGFWRDLRWWSEHLRVRNSVAIEPRRQGEAAITATDASDWGCGELAWLNGQRAESVVQFTEAERRRPINWRELFGVYRVLAVWGSELKGRLVLLETDNMAAKGAAAKGSSTSLDMQELVRRIMELCEQHDIQVRLTHTPGVKLLRPDATSRGDPMEEPRHRLQRGTFEGIWRRMGPFTEMVGAERDFVGALRGGVNGERPAGPRAWVHPSHATVGSALRLMLERMAEDASFSGAMIVPWAPEALWWPMLRHVDIAGVMGSGRMYLESNRLGVWDATVAKRTALIVTFPRMAGTARVAAARCELSPGEGYAWHAESGLWVLQLLEGAVLYSPAGLGTAGATAKPGGVVQLVQKIDVDDLQGGAEPMASCARVLQASKAVQRAHAGVQGTIFEMDPNRRETYKLVSRATRGEDAVWAPWGYDLTALWEVPGTATMASPVNPAETRAYERGSLLFSFDWERAEADIARARTQCAAPTAEAAGELAEPTTPTSIHHWTVGAASACKTWEGRPPSGASPAQRGTRDLVQPEVMPIRALIDDEEETLEDSAPASAPGPARVSPEAAGRPAACRYEGITCLGCGQHFTRGRVMEPFGSSYVHPRTECRLQAVEKRLGALQIVEPPIEQGAPANQLGSALRRVQLQEKFSNERLQRVVTCLSGKCSRPEGKQIRCLRGCGNRVHAECAQVGEGHATLGNLVCVTCRLSEMGVRAEDEVAPERARIALITMMMALTRGMASTSHGYGEYDRIERLYTSGFGARAQGGLLAPRHNKEAFTQMLTWFVLDAERALSLRSFVRSAGAFLTITGLTDWTKHREVKAHVDELIEQQGLESQPATHGTMRMLRLLMFAVLPKLCRTELILRRARLLLVLEAIGGLRVGEAVSGGDHHGLLANNTCVLKSRRTGEVSVEGRLEHSKTHRVRWFNMVGLSEGSKAPVARFLQEYWESAGTPVRRTREGGFDVIRPDYTVVRVSLLGLPDDGMRRLETALRASKVNEVAALAASTMGYARTRAKLKHDVEEKAYVNVAGGAADAESLRIVMEELKAAGLGKFARLSLGPLMRATSGKRCTHMPLAPSSTYTLLHKSMDAAYVLANRDPADPDPELDLGGATKPKWANHSWRRYADKMARATMAQTGATVIDIDRFFGWLEHHYEKLMQLHYAGREDRVKRSNVTRMA